MTSAISPGRSKETAGGGLPRPRASAPRALTTVAALLLACATGDGTPAGAGTEPPPAPAGREQAEPARSAEPGAGFRGPGPHFAARRLRRLDVRPEHLLAGDLDGDGHGDLLVTAEGAGTLLLWRGGPAGLAAGAEVLAAGGWPLRPVLVSGTLELPRSEGGPDRAPDGPGSGEEEGPVPRPDAPPDAPDEGLRVALASRAERTLALHDLATGAVRELWRGGEDEGRPRALASGGAGAADGNQGGSTLALALDGGLLLVMGGGRSERVQLDGWLPRCARVLAGGGEVVVGFQDTRALEVVARGPAGLERAATLELDFIPRDLVELDLDGDGDLELAVLGGADTLRVLGLGRPGGSRAWLEHGRSGEAPRDLRTAAVPLAATAADLDGDGADELVVVSVYGLRYEVFAAGPGGPVRRASGYAGQTPRGLACGDFDADGALDLAVACSGARALALLWGDGAGGLLQAAQVPVGAAPNALAPLSGAEAPGAGGTPVAVGVLEAKGLAGHPSVGLLERRDGSLARRGLGPTGESPKALVAVDWDRDGAPELAWLEGEGRTALVVVPAAGGARTELGSLRGALDLVAVEQVAVEPGGSASGEAAGSPALVAAEQGARALVLFAPGRAPVRLTWSDAAPIALAVVELDGDDGPELAVALGSPGPRRGVALVDVRVAGGKAELFETGFVASAHWPIDLAPLAGAGEGNLRLAVLSLYDPRTPAGALELFEHGDPAEGGGLRSLQVVPAGSNPKHLAAGDVDGDGLDELFAAAQNGHRLHLWSQVEGRLEERDALGAHLGCLDVALADVDGDGRPEVLVANGFSDDVSLIRALP